MATVYPFFFLAFHGQWWIPVVNTVFYAIGIIFFTSLLPYFKGEAVGLLGESTTIHSAIARLHGAPSLRKITAWMTIIAFSGLAVFEITWGAVVFQILFESADFIYYFAVVILALYLILYVWVGGQEAAIRTSQYQLLFSYAGLHALVGWIAWQPAADFRNGPLQIIVPAVILISIVFLFYRLKNAPSRTAPPFLRRLNALTILSGALMVLFLVSRGDKIVPTFDFSFLSSVPETPYFWLIFLSVACLPLGFQFVDMTNWQRLTALKPNGGGLVKQARTGVIWYLRESPLSWLLPILAGLACLQFISLSKEQDPWLVLLSAVRDTPGITGMVMAVFVFVGIVAIFMSTAEELLTAIGYAFSFDLKSSTRKIADQYDVNQDALVTEDEGQLMITTGRVAFATATGAVIVLFFAADKLWGAGPDLIALFLAFFSPLIALAPSLIMPAWTGRVAKPGFAVASIVGGAGVGLLLGLWATIEPTALDEAARWLASPASFAVSWIIYVFGWMMGAPILSERAENEALRGEP
jgi:hypothetical protein